MMTKGGGGFQKSQKIDDVFYERPLNEKWEFLWDFKSGILEN